MRTLRLAACIAAFLMVGYAQTDRGIITGNVTDPSGAVVPAAAITATNTENGAKFETQSTNTGAYTIPQLPAGPYSVEVTSQGFEKFIQQGIRIQVDQTARVDVVLQLGAATQSVTINADAPLLRTEEAEQSANIATQQELNLPLFGGDGRAAGALGGLRSPYAFMATMPGSGIISSSPTAANNSLRVNGLPNDTSVMRIEGQESTNTQQSSAVHINPSVEAMEEVTLEGSNFAPEFGQVGAGVINFSVKSGTNNIHGSVFDYFRNEFMNAGQPFSNNGHGGLLVARARGNNYGGSVGGPIYIPKVFNGKNRAFFFFNVESAPGTSALAGTYLTLPTTAMRTGNFSSILTGRNLGTDPLGNAILENTVYDPASSQTVNGLVVRTPFPSNIIPANRLDPVSVKIQALMPLPTTTGQINNWVQNWSTSTAAKVYTTKEDFNLSASSKISYYLSWKLLRAPNSPDGLPDPISATRGGQTGNNSPTTRLSFDHTLSPTLLFHVGIGFIRNETLDLADPATLDYDAVKNLGLVGGVPVNFVGGVTAVGFPRLNNMSGALGGSTNLGPANANYYYMEKPTAIASLMWVKGNHSFKFGADWRKDGQTDINVRGTQGIYTFDPNETGLPSNGLSLSGGTVGFAYASFLMGLADSASVASPQEPQFVRVSTGIYAQDSWKVSRKLTLVYGVRYDYQTGIHELFHRFAVFQPSVLNPSAGNRPGGFAYEGFGPGRCNCESFAKNYPYGFQPRIGLAYQVNPKTVIRAGWGLAMSQNPNAGYLSNTPIVGVGFNQLAWYQPSYGQPAVTLQGGLQYNPADLYSVTLNPGIRPIPGGVSAPTYWPDPQGGRPGRINQWSIGVQRQVTPNLAVEANYVGNHGVWLDTTVMNDLNAITPQILTNAGININNAADRSLLTSQLGSATAQARGITAPYAGYPLTQTVVQSLRPYPQFLNIPVIWTPRGSSWYDSLQTKLTKRFSHGIVSATNFTWAPTENTLGAEGGTVNDVYNRQNQKSPSSYSQPFVFVTSTSYTTPGVGASRWMRLATSQWTLGTVLRYQSGTPQPVPAAQNAQQSYFFRPTVSDRVPGAPLFLYNLNCHCFDPNKVAVLNPAAWVDPGPGQWGTSALYYTDYRYARRPSEAVNLTRVFTVRESVRIELQAMFFNIFNRTFLNNPTNTNAKATLSYSNGNLISGFGQISTASTNQLPRTGLLSARIQF